MSTVNDVKNQISTTKVVTVMDFLEKQRDLIARVLPKTITPDRMIGIFMMILKSSPALTKCSHQSLIGAVIQTTQLGLQVGNIGYVYLVPFNNRGVMEVQLIVGYKGLCELVNRSGKATILTSEVVYENDDFHYELGLNPILRHVPKEGNRGAFRGVYCIAKNLIANEKVFVYLNKDEVEKVRNASKAKSSEYSPWHTWFDEMAKKTSVKRITKLLPLSAEEQSAISADETIKTKIDKDMASLPDETDWNGQTIDVSDTTKQEPKPEEAVKQGAEQEKVPENGNSASSDGNKNNSANVISQAQAKRLYAIATSKGIPNIKEWLMFNFNYSSTSDIDKKDYEKICKGAEDYVKK